MKSFRVALLANLKTNAPHIEGMPEDQWADLDSEKTVNCLVEAIRSGGHTCEFLEGDVTLFDTIRRFKPDICFNICEGHFGDAREAQIPALLEMMRIPYTGSKVLALALSLDKPMTKRILHWHELPTPAFQTFERADEPLHDDMTFPLFVKPSREGTGMGVSGKSIVHDEDLVGTEGLGRDRLEAPREVPLRVVGGYVERDVGPWVHGGSSEGCRGRAVPGLMRMPRPPGLTPARAPWARPAAARP